MGGTPLFPSWVASFSQFGIRGTSRCQVDPAIWNQNCHVPQVRKDRVFIDLASCSLVDQVLRDTLVTAYFDLQSVLRTEIGWDVARVFTADAASITLKCDPSLGAGGKGTREISHCWNLPGFPHDVCFFKNSTGLARIGLEAIQASSGTGLSAQRAVFNIVRHELLHTMGWGHFPGAGDIMNTNQPDSFLTDLSASQIDMMRNFLVQSHKGSPHYCNWQPGDPLNSICPNSVPAP
jgi:hypothetical protein